MKKFSYNGQIITASSKSEAIVKILAKPFDFSEEVDYYNSDNDDEFPYKISLNAYTLDGKHHLEKETVKFKKLIKKLAESISGLTKPKEIEKKIEDYFGSYCKKCEVVTYDVSKEEKSITYFIDVMDKIGYEFSLKLKVSENEKYKDIFTKAQHGDKSILNLPKELLMIKDNEGATPVHRLAGIGVKEVLKLPKEMLMTKDDYEETPVHWIAREGVKEILKLPKELLMIKNDWGSTPVHYLACNLEEGVKEVLKLPKEMLMAKNKDGDTPVHELARKGFKEILKLPKELLMIKNDDGDTPKDLLQNN